MVKIKPFKGTRYNISVIEDLGNVIAPPYDVIKPEMQDAYYDRHSHNVVRLILGKEKRNDDEYNNKYNRAGNYFQSWKRDGILVDDERDGMYFYQQIFTLPSGKKKKRSGFFALVELEDFEGGNIKAHENTFGEPKADRLQLIRATKSNLSSIFALYTDVEKVIDAIVNERVKQKPWLECVDEDGIEHRIWVVKNRGICAEIVAAMSEKTVFIADGHHRYETCLMYRDELGESEKNDERLPQNYTLMYFVNTENEGLVILPTHRLLSNELETEVDEVIEDLEEYFDVKQLKVDLTSPQRAEKIIANAISQPGAVRFAMLLPDNRAYTLTLKKGADLDEMIQQEMVKVKKELPVTILQEFVIKQVWVGNPDMELDQEDIEYVKDMKVAVESLMEGKFCVAFILNPPDVEMVKKVAQSGERMPEKSTYFYPKIATGLVMRDMTVQ